MKWLWSGRTVFWILVIVILGISAGLINQVTRESIVQNRYIAFARMAPSQQEKWLALFILQEVQDLVPGLSVQLVDLPGSDRETLEVVAELTHESEREALAERMQLIFSVLNQFGYYGEHRIVDQGDRFYIFRDLLPWFVLDALLVPPYQVALVIDDFGYSLEEAERFIALEPNITMAVFPHLPLSRAISRRAQEAGREVIIHFPMEAIDPTQNERESFLLQTGTDSETIRRMLREALEGVPHAVGLNNHKGSRATSDRPLMEHFMGILNEKGLFFLDSVTASSSLAYALAQEVGIESYRRDIFLDGENSRDYVLGQLRETVSLARRQGYAVAIGHPKDGTYQALVEFFRDFNDGEVAFVYLSQLRR